MCSVDEEIKIQIFESFGKTEKSVNEYVEIVRTWIKTQPHLPEIMDEAYIRNFLLLNKFNVEKTKQKIDMYYTIRTLIPEWFHNSNPKLPHMKDILENVYVGMYPKVVNGIHRAYFFKLKSPHTWSPFDYFKAVINLYEIRLNEDYIVSDYLICDLSTMTLDDMVRLTPGLVAKFLAIYKKVYSLPIKRIIYFNSPPYVDVLVNLLKNVMKPKIFQLLHVSTDDAILKEIFDEGSLPEDYGGDGPSLQKMTDLTKERFAHYQDRFDKLDILRIDESSRPMKLVNDEILGFYGNFRKFELDQEQGI